MFVLPFQLLGQFYDCFEIWYAHYIIADHLNVAFLFVCLFTTIGNSTVNAINLGWERRYLHLICGLDCVL